MKLETIVQSCIHFKNFLPFFARGPRRRDKAAGAGGVVFAPWRAQKVTDGEHDQMQLGPINRNTLYLIVGALAVAVVVLGYQLYQERKEPQGVQINVGPGGISIEKK